MLKFIYTENGFHLERVPQSLEAWVKTRVIFSLRAGTSISIEPSTASFLLQVGLPELAQLVAKLEPEAGKVVQVSFADADYLEITLQGTWVNSCANGDQGMFVTAASDRLEENLLKMWQVAQTYATISE